MLAIGLVVVAIFDVGGGDGCSTPPVFFVRYVFGPSPRIASQNFPGKLELLRTNLETGLSQGLDFFRARKNLRELRLRPLSETPFFFHLT